MDKIRKVEQLLKLQADYKKYMEVSGEAELDLEELDQVAAATDAPYERFYNQFLKNLK